MSDGRDEREKRHEQAEREESEDRIDREPADQWEPERVDTPEGPSMTLYRVGAAIRRGICERSKAVA
jgi:hypothetical protein